MKVNFHNRGQSLIGIIIVLMMVGLITGGLYYYLSKQTLKVSEITEKPAEEQIVKPEEEMITPLPEEELPKEEITPEEVKEKPNEKPIIQKCADGTPYSQCSTSRPKYCENGSLVNKCDICGCEKDYFCIYNQCRKENVDELFRDVFGDKLNIIASEDPSFFIGDSIGQYVFDTSWISYQPMIEKVKELIEGKSTNYEKANSIVNWVIKSRNYKETSLIEHKSIQDVFESDVGVCYDSAQLTVAMFRLAGIPSRVVSIRIHSYVEFYSNGKWLGVDSTFCVDSNNCLGDRIMTEKTSILNSFKYIKLKQPVEVIKREHHTDRVFYYLVDSIILSVKSKKDLLSDFSSIENDGGYRKEKIEWGELTFIYPFYGFPGYDYIGAKLEAKNFQCDEYDCGEMKGISERISMVPSIFVVASKMAIFENERKVEESNNVVSSQPFLFEDYYITAPLPPGEYRFWYQSPKIAYVDIEIKPGEKVTIKPESLLKPGDITSEQFNKFINYLKTVK